MTEGSPDALLDRVSHTIGARLDEAFHQVELVRARVADIAERAAERRRQPDRAALAAIRPYVQDLLTRDDPLLDGLGVAVGPDNLVDAAHWLEWWRRDGVGGASKFVPHTLNPDAVGFYDYQSREWFRAPNERGGALAIGPYYDSGGIDVYTVTLATPLNWASGGESIVGGDLSIPGIEALLLHSLGTRRHQVVLVAANNRVIASNSARHVTGSRLTMAEGEEITHTVPVASRDSQRLPWRLIALTQGR